MLLRTDPPSPCCATRKDGQSGDDSTECSAAVQVQEQMRLQMSRPQMIFLCIREQWDREKDKPNCVVPDNDAKTGQQFESILDEPLRLFDLYKLGLIVLA